MIETLNLHGGFLKLSAPYRWYGLLGYALFGIMALVGLVMSLTNLGNSDDIVAGMAISIVGLIGLAVTTPSSHQIRCYVLRPHNQEKYRIQINKRRLFKVVKNKMKIF